MGKRSKGQSNSAVRAAALEAKTGLFSMSGRGKRAAGGGRSKLGGNSLSRLKFPCTVPTCDCTFRSDKIRAHYLSCVKFDDFGLPLDPDSTEFDTLNLKMKEHTRYFASNSFSLKNMPPPGKPVPAESSVRNYFLKSNNDHDLSGTESEPMIKRRRIDNAASKKAFDEDLVPNSTETQEVAARKVDQPGETSVDWAVSDAGARQDIAEEVCGGAACGWCLSCPGPEMLQLCSVCSIVAYCGAKCQGESWSTHKKVCKKLKGEAWGLKVELVGQMITMARSRNFKRKMGKENEDLGNDDKGDETRENDAAVTEDSADLEETTTKDTPIQDSEEARKMDCNEDSEDSGSDEELQRRLNELRGPSASPAPPSRPAAALVSDYGCNCPGGVCETCQPPCLDTEADPLGIIGMIVEDGNNNDVRIESIEDRLADKISKKVLDRLGVKSDKTLQSLIAEAVEESLDKTKPETETPEGAWLESEEHFTCEICVSLSVLEVPGHLIRLKKGSFGTISKDQAKWHVKAALLLHVNNPLHKWCTNKLKEMSESKAKDDMANVKAANLLATNAALCFKTFGSAQDFQRLNDKDNLTEGLSPAFKNDGKQRVLFLQEHFLLEAD